MSMAILNVQVPLPQHSVEVEVVVHKLNGYWMISITVAIPLHFVPENLWMVVEVTPSILKDDPQGRRGPSCEYSTTVVGRLLALTDD